MKFFKFTAPSVIGLLTPSQLKIEQVGGQKTAMPLPVSTHDELYLEIETMLQLMAISMLHTCHLKRVVIF